MSDHIITYSEIKFSPFNPSKENISIDDIAHALSGAYFIFIFITFLLYD